MKESRYNRTLRNKKKLTPVVIAAVLLMFLLRIILIRSGKLAEITELSTQELQEYISQTEVSIAEDYGGTLIDSFKTSTKDDIFSTYAVAPIEAILTENAGERVTVATSDFESYEGKIVAVNEADGIALICIQTMEEASEASYNKDYFYSLEKNDEVFWLYDGEIQRSTVSDRSNEEIMVSVLNENKVMIGTGAYDIHGAYIGMVVKEEDSVIKIVPADRIIQFTTENN